MDDGYRSSISNLSGYSRPTGSNLGAMGSSSRTLRIVTEMGSSSVSGMSSGMATNAAKSVVDHRDREKKDLADLNDRLASYIEKVRFLEAQNRKLAADLEALRGRWGKDTSSVKSMYEGELSEARKLMDETGRQKADLEIQIARLQDDIADWRRKYQDAAGQHSGDKEKIDGLVAQLSDAEAEIGLLRRRVQNLDDETKRLKEQNSQLSSELQKARVDLDHETLNRIDYQNQVQTLLEEIEFLRRVHDQEIKELQALATRDTTSENREYFRNELAMAIRDIRLEYDTITSQNKTDMESWYKLKVQEVQTASQKTSMETSYSREEVKRMRNQLGDMRGKLSDLETQNTILEKQVKELTYQLEDDQRQYETALNDRDAQIRKMREECQALMVELQLLLDTKQTLDAEIAIYRKMLEGEENRTGLRDLVDTVTSGGSHGIHFSEDMDSSRIIKGEIATRTSFQRSAKGNVSIAECEAEGKFIVLENTHRTKDENLDGWKLKRKLDGRKEIVYTLPSNLVLGPGQSVKIWARNQGGNYNPPHELVFEAEETWGTGSNVQTFLYNRESEERATHIQRTTQQ